MIVAEGNTISINRGDDAAIDVAITVSGTAYTMQEGDILTLTVREVPESSSTVLLQVNSRSGSNRITLTHSATAGLVPGKYSCDIQLTMSDGKICTVFPGFEGLGSPKPKNWKNFIVYPEVTA